MTLTLLTAVTGPAEATLVTGLERGSGDVRVVHRCVDLADLLATAATGQARAVVVSADLRRLDGAALAHLRASGLVVVVLVTPGDDAAHRRLRQLGVDAVLPADSAAADVAAAAAAAVARLEARTTTGGLPSLHDVGDPAHALRPGPQAVTTATSTSVSAAEPEPGSLVAVWGPTGAPGRTTVAVTLAVELAAAGAWTLLADADTYGGSVAQTLGLLDEAPGLAVAARAADLGTLDLASLRAAAPAVLDRLRVLTGIVRASRWPELRPGALARVWELSRLLGDCTVVDCGFSLELDEELTYDTAAPRRNGATVATLEAADVVVAVGSADPVGLQRLVRGLADLAQTVPQAQPLVVVNRVRGSAVGTNPGRRVREALERFAGVVDPVLVPDDRGACDAALLAGLALTESAAGSPARLALAELAADLRTRLAMPRWPGAGAPDHA